MVRYAFLRAAIFVASLAGAALAAAAIATLAEPGATASAGAFFTALFAKAPSILVLDLGHSRISGLAAVTEISPALQASAKLLVIGTLIAIVAGVPLGISLASPPTRPVIALLVQLVGSVPVFCVALAIAIAFAALAPSSGEIPSLLAPFFPQDKDAAAALMAFAPPAVTVGFAGAGAVALSVHNALDIAAREHYREGLRRLGLGDGEILRVYVARHALALLLKDAGEIVLALFAAVAVAEWVFTWPGVGAAFIHAVALADWPVVGVVVFIIALVHSTADFLGPLATRALIAERSAP